MRKHVKRVLYLIAAIWFSAAGAGSYEDFFAAIKQDNPQAVKALLDRGFDANTPSPEKLHGLYLALREGSVKTARTLVDWPKTHIEARTPQDESPLMMAALKGHEELVKRLIERDADVNKPGWAPLHYAATGGHVGIIELLLEHHAFIDAQSPNGTTPLMMAAQYGSPKAVQVLLEAGADVTMRNQLGLSAVDFAQQGGRRESAALITQAIRSKPSTGKW
jgi:ankyrin repeat protein